MSKNKVLIPIDGSAFSLQILPYVKQLLDPADNELILLHVEPEPESIHIERPGFEPLDVYADQTEDSMRTQFAVTMKPVAQELREAGFETSTDMSFGRPAQAIETHIEYAPVDMIAMTTHGRSGLDRVMLGSVAEHVLRHCHVPVMLLHPLTDIHKRNGSQNR